MSLDLSGNQVADLAPPSAPSVGSSLLHLARNNVSNLGPIAGLSGSRPSTLGENPIEDVGAAGEAHLGFRIS